MVRIGEKHNILLPAEQTIQPRTLDERDNLVLLSMENQCRDGDRGG